MPPLRRFQPAIVCSRENAGYGRSTTNQRTRTPANNEPACAYRCSRELARYRRTFTCAGFGTRLPVKPGVARRVGARVIGVKIDEYPLNLKVADLKHIAPAAGVRDTGP